ncbi:hypothetical protein GCM10017556_54380 [Micromonospora sagamiensis]|nr:hypothetical protein GCM10017556_54380 [Micromonospora sagamiensis]
MRTWRKWVGRRGRRGHDGRRNGGEPVVVATPAIAGRKAAVLPGTVPNARQAPVATELAGPPGDPGDMATVRLIRTKGTPWPVARTVRARPDPSTTAAGAVVR